MKETVLKKLTYAIEGYTDTDTPELQIMSFERNLESCEEEYKIIIRHNKPTAATVGVENECNE